MSPPRPVRSLEWASLGANEVLDEPLSATLRDPRQCRLDDGSRRASVRSSSPKKTASPISCVTMTTVLSSASKISARSSCKRGADDRVEGAERLVQSKIGGIQHQRANQADALLLTARQFLRGSDRARTRGSSVSSTSSCSPRGRASSQPRWRAIKRGVRRALRCGNNPPSWMTYPILRRIRARWTPRPRRRRHAHLPDVGDSSPLISLSVVDLPQPLGPMRIVVRPSLDAQDHGIDGEFIPEALVTESSSIIAARDGSCGSFRGTRRRPRPLPSTRLARSHWSVLSST